jgi:hypothetical protein
MTKRICHIHVGPHKAGTTSIQWFFQENRTELLNDGYFVPESETKRGSHHALVEALAGLDVGEHREPLVAKSIAEIAGTPAQAIIISSEALEGLFRNRQNTKTFFNQIQELSSNQSSSSSRATSRNGSIRAIPTRSKPFAGPIRSDWARSVSLNLQTQGSHVGLNWQKLMASN